MSTRPVDQPELKRAIGPRLLLLFIVGDILGTGIYALVGTVAGEVGGLVWLPFLLAFVVAAITALSYLELVTRYPLAAGAALYVHQAFRRNFVTFLIGFAVLCGGVTTAATGANAFARFLRDGFDLALPTGSTGYVAVVLLIVLALAVVNLLGISESMQVNVVLTLVELAGLLLVIGVGVVALGGGRGDLSQLVVFESTGDRNVFVALSTATALAFFAMIGFEDAVNLAEESTDPVQHFPRTMLTAVGITGTIYVLVAICAVALVPVGDLADPDRGSALTQVVAAAAPGLPLDDLFPFIGLFAVANTALLNLLMASRLLYGMARQGVVPPVFATVHPRRRTPWVSILAASGLTAAVAAYGGLHHRATGQDPLAVLGGTASLLVLGVFAVVNVALLVLRRREPGHPHFRAPRAAPWLGTATCLFLVGPWARASGEFVQYRIAAYLLATGVALWLLNRALVAVRH